MGREIRRVPPNWEHPKEEKPNFMKQCMEMRYRAMYDESYSKSIAEWIESHLLWEKGEHKDQQDAETKAEYRYYAQWAGNPPSVDSYRPDWKEEEMTWYQVYETVSEGTPVTPPFETQAELVDYLVENGDFWDQSRRKDGGHVVEIMNCQPWSRKQAESFVYGAGWAPSLVFTPETGLVSGVEAMARIQE